MARTHRTKKSEKDFKKSMLPQTRRDVFFDVLKLQWSKLLRVALLLLIAALPLLLIAVYEDSYILTVYEDSAVPPESVPALLAPLHIYCAILSVPCIALFFLGLSGVIRVIRQLTWEENAMVFPDFMKGIRQNWKPFIPIGLLFGLGYAFAKIGWHNALAAQGNSVWLQGISLGLLILLIAPTAATCVVTVAIYNNRFFDHLRLAFYLYLKAPLKTVLAVLLAFGPSAAVWVIPHLQLQLWGSIPAMMVFTLGLTGFTLYTYDQLDKYYNAAEYPELVGKGIG